MRRVVPVLLALVLAIPLLVSAAPAPVQGAADTPPGAATATSFQSFIETDSPACLPVLGGYDVTSAPYFADGDCGYTDIGLADVPAGATITAQMVSPGEGPTKQLDVTDNGDGTVTVGYQLDETFPTGDGALEVLVDDEVVGSTPLYHNALQVTLDAPDGHAPGEAISVTGTVEEVSYGSGVEAIAGSEQRTGVPASFTLQVRGPDGTVHRVTDPVTAEGDGTFSATLPGTATAALSPEPGSFTLTAAVEAVDATYDDAGTPWAAATAGTTPLELSEPPSTLQLGTSFASSTGGSSRATRSRSA